MRIEFVSLRGLTLIALLLSCASTQPFRPIQITNLQVGEFEISPGARPTLIRATRSIPCALRTHFGVSFFLEGSRSTQLIAEWRHPGIEVAESSSPKEKTVVQAAFEPRADRPAYVANIWTISERAEQQPGQWELRISYGAQTLVTEQFELRDCPPAA